MQCLRGCGRLGFPFLPLTFPNVTFSAQAGKLGYDIGWLEAGRIWDLYEQGIMAGSIKRPGNSTDTINYLKSRGVAGETAEGWAATLEILFNRGDLGERFYNPSAGTLLTDAAKEVVGTPVKIGKEIIGAAAQAAGLSFKPVYYIGGALLVTGAVVLYLNNAKRRS